MVLFDTKVLPSGVNIAPKMSNQTPVGPANPMPIAYQGVPQHIKTKVPTYLPPTVIPGSYAEQGIWPGGVHQLQKNIPGRINPPAWYDSLGYQGVAQHIKVPIRQIVPGDVYPDTYGAKKMSYGIDAGSVIGGAIVGFILGAIVFTATGRQFAGSVGRRVQTEAGYLAGRAAGYIEPKS